MITALHALVYADDAGAARAFFRDVLGWPCVDGGGGWLIFATGPSELGVHPTSGGSGGEAWSAPRQHLLSLVCDDLEATMRELERRGASFSSGVHEEGFGRTAMLDVPGADAIMLYEPRHPLAYTLRGS